MKLKALFIFLITTLAFTALSAQDFSYKTSPAELFNERGEIYFKFDASGLDVNHLTRIISIDKVENSEVWAYANLKEFTSFLKLNVDFTLLPKPGEALKNPKMLNSVNIREITEWDFYPTYTAYVSMMNQFATDYPQLCQVSSIGNTIENRQLLMAKISDNVAVKEAEPQFLYTGTIHGDETTGYILLLRLIDYLLTNYGVLPDVTYLVDNVEIWINPLSNPDGTYAGGNNTVNGATRYNANYVDMNRNYADPEDGQHPDGEEWQPETVAFMQFAEDNNFVMSANTHGGEEVLNYPWDTWSRLSADDSWWVFVSRQYVDTVHLYSPSNYLNEFENGITNGYAWYTISGGRQDYMNYFHNCREITMELSDTKLLPTNQLQNHWQWNYRSLLNYIEQCTFGVKGVVTDIGTGLPIEAKVFIEGHDLDNSFVFSEGTTGFYQRLLDQGNYDLTFSAPGYYPVTVENVAVSRYSATTINVQLDAGTLIADFTASATTVSIGGLVNFTDVSFGGPVSWLWEFEGGTPATSTQKNPQGISYQQTGNYDVTLTVTNSAGTPATITKSDFISVNAEFLMNNQSVTTCEGLFYDSGGNTSNYNDDEDFTKTFYPGTLGAKVIAEFQLFDVEYNSSCSYDWLKIYNGTTITAPLIGTYCGTNSPGTVTASNTSGALTFQFHSDYSENHQGWKALISCSSVPLLPVADFEADTNHIRMGESIHFTDLTANNPTNWAWVFEGGTPASSSLQNPVILYEEPGIYDVTLIVQNQFGSDTKIIQNYITVDSTIGIDELLKMGIRVFPNPVTEGMITISAPQDILEVQIFDFTGKSMIKLSPANKEVFVSTSSLTKGIYLLKVLSGKEWVTTKINILN